MSNFPGHNISCHTAVAVEASCVLRSAYWAFRGIIFLALALPAFAATCPRCFNESPRVVSTKTEAVSNPVRGPFTIQRTEYKCGKCGNKFRVIKELPPTPPLPVVRAPSDPRPAPFAMRAIVLPPMPPGVPAATLAPRTANFQPAAGAATVLPEPRPIYISKIYIDPEFGDFYLVSALQKGGGTLEMQWAESPTGPWHFLAGYGYYPDDQYVGASIPAHWPGGRMFVCAKNTPSDAPPAAALAAARAAGRDTGKTLKVAGKTYRLIETSGPGVQFRTYRLQPL